jgi:hypothetical protein
MDLQKRVRSAGPRVLRYCLLDQLLDDSFGRRFPDGGRCCLVYVDVDDVVRLVGGLAGGFCFGHSLSGHTRSPHTPRVAARQTCLLSSDGLSRLELRRCIRNTQDWNTWYALYPSHSSMDSSYIECSWYTIVRVEFPVHGGPGGHVAHMVPNVVGKGKIAHWLQMVTCWIA